jgi:ABC-type transporter Mla subunit MlaD
MRRFNLRLLHALARLETRHSVPVGIAAALVIAFLTWTVIQAVNSVPFTTPYRASAVVAPDAPILRPGDEVRVAGRRAGQVRKVAYVRGGRRVEFALDKGRLGLDASATVRQRGFSGSVYLLVKRGDTNRPMPEGDTIPITRTSATDQLANVVTAFDRETQTALTRSAVGYGGGLRDRGADVNRAIGDLRQLTENGTPVLQALTPAPGELAGMVANLSRTARGFSGSQPTSLERLLAHVRPALEILNQRRSSLGGLADVLRPVDDEIQRTLPIADPLLGDLRRVADRLTPAIAQFRSTFPALSGLLRDDEKLADLGRLSAALGPAAHAGGPALDRLRPVGATLAPLATPTGALGRYLDPFRDDLVQAMVNFQDFTRSRFTEGKASGAAAVRFNPVFTCAPARHPYAPPGVAWRERAAAPPRC